MAGMVEVWFKYAIIIIIIKTDRSMVEVGVVSPFLPLRFLLTISLLLVAPSEEMSGEVFASFPFEGWGGWT
jgi:hypothetical protein